MLMWAPGSASWGFGALYMAAPTVAIAPAMAISCTSAAPRPAYPAKCVCSGVLTSRRPDRIVIATPSARAELCTRTTRAAPNSPPP